MSLKTYLKILFSLTVVALIYTHMQMQIVELAYKGKEKERRIHDLVDANGVLTHQILTLKSANNLGNQLLEKNSNLQFMGNDHIMTLKAPAQSIRQPAVAPKHKENPFWQILSFLGAQEARAWQ